MSQSCVPMMIHSFTVLVRYSFIHRFVRYYYLLNQSNLASFYLDDVSWYIAEVIVGSVGLRRGVEKYHFLAFFTGLL